MGTSYYYKAQKNRAFIEGCVYLIKLCYFYNSPSPSTSLSFFVIYCDLCRVLLSIFINHCVCKTILYGSLRAGSWLVGENAITLHGHFATVCGLRYTHNFNASSFVVG